MAPSKGMIEERVNIDQRLSALEAKFDVTFLPACVTTLGRIHSEFLRLIYFISNKQAVDYFEDLGYDAHKEEFCHRRGVFFHNNRCTLGMTCAQAVAMRGAPTAARRLVAAPRNQQPFRFDPHEFDRDFSHLSDVTATSDR